VPWDDAGAFLRFSATYLARDEAAEDALMAETVERLGRLKLRFEPEGRPAFERGPARTPDRESHSHCRCCALYLRPYRTGSFSAPASSRHIPPELI
jgi:hypothetical protein